MSLESILLNISSVDITFTPAELLGRIFYAKEGIGIEQKDLAEKLKNATEARDVRDLYQRDINGIFGKALNKVLDWKKYDRRMPDHYVWLDMPEQAMAATIKGVDEKGRETTILAYNSKHRERLLNNRFLRLYVNLHEHGHVRGEHSEEYTEGLVGDAARQIKKGIEYLAKLSRGIPNKLKGLYQQATQIAELADQRAYAQAGK